MLTHYPQANTQSNDCTVAWVTRPEQLKGVKDEVKQARRAASLKSNRPLDFYTIWYQQGNDITITITIGPASPIFQDKSFHRPKIQLTTRHNVEKQAAGN